MDTRPFQKMTHFPSFTATRLNIQTYVTPFPSGINAVISHIDMIFFYYSFCLGYINIITSFLLQNWFFSLYSQLTPILNQSNTIMLWMMCTFIAYFLVCSVSWTKWYYSIQRITVIIFFSCPVWPWWPREVYLNVSIMADRFYSLNYKKQNYDCWQSVILEEIKCFLWFMIYDG